jgi:hypothetical protein
MTAPGIDSESEPTEFFLTKVKNGLKKAAEPKPPGKEQEFSFERWKQCHRTDYLKREIK